MKKMSFIELREIIEKHNEKHNIVSEFSDKKPIYGIIVFKQENFNREYTVKERSYIIRSDCKTFLPGLCGNSLYGDCLDKKDLGVRLDNYNWIVEYCYIKSGGKK